MGSTSMPGGFGRALGIASQKPIRPLMNQSSCCSSLLGDREKDRPSVNRSRALEDAEDSSAMDFRLCRNSAAVACSDLRIGSASVGSGYASHGSGRRASTKNPAGERGTGISRASYLGPTSGRSPMRKPAPIHPNLGFAPCLRLYRRSDGLQGKQGWDSISGQRGSLTIMAARPDEGKERLSGPDFRQAAGMQMMKEWTSKQFISGSESESEASWEPLNIAVRVLYALAMYGGLAVAGNALCTVAGVDCWGGFKLSQETFAEALGWAVPPMMALLLILEDEVVKVCPPARAIRDVEDEELLDFFVGMNPCQFTFVVAMGALSEELFFRAAIQGGLARALQYTATSAEETVIGVSALTRVVPVFTPFAQACAAVITASLTGSMYYVISSSKDPAYVISLLPVKKSGWNTRRDIKKRIEAWYERRQLKKIYSPLVEALLALYLGFEWVQTGNIFGPMITHTFYTLVVAGSRLRRIEDNRHKLHQRVKKVTHQNQVNSDPVSIDK